MATKKSLKGKNYYATYKSLSIVMTNKVKKLERHIKLYPNDEAAKKALVAIKAGKFKVRTAPKRNVARQDVFEARVLNPKGLDVKHDKVLADMGFDSVQETHVVSRNLLCGRLSSKGKTAQEVDSMKAKFEREAQFERPVAKETKRVVKRKTRRAVKEELTKTA